MFTTKRLEKKWKEKQGLTLHSKFQSRGFFSQNNTNQGCPENGWMHDAEMREYQMLQRKVCPENYKDKKNVENSSAGLKCEGLTGLCFNTQYKPGC